MANPIRTGNRVEFLLDGEEIFGALLDGFLSVINATAGTANTYVRLAFWLIQDGVSLGSANRRHRDRLIDYIEDVLELGFDVEIILWYPANALTQKGMKEQVAQHDAFARRVRAREKRQARLSATPGNARVFKERYEGPMKGSQHQKMAIFSVGGQRTAIVGGLNLAERYFDTVDHNYIVNPRDPPKKRRNSNWHDTALQIKGPVTADIEAEWVRRWNRVVALATGGKSIQNKRARLKSRHYDGPERGHARAWTVTDNTTVQTTYTTGALGNAYDNVHSQVRLTRKDGTAQTKEILTTLLARICNATIRIYLENCQLTDPLIISALYNRMKIKPGLHVVVVTNPAGGGQGYLTRRAWLHLALRHPTCRSVTYYNTDGSKATIARGTGTNPAWTVLDCHRPTNPEQYQWLEADQISFKVSGRTVTKRFHEIADVDVDFHFYTPAVHRGWYKRTNTDGVVQKDTKGNTIYDASFRTLCIHSKLMVIDNWVICGSSNWTYRSMQYDGEISIFNESAALANHVVDTMFQHYDWIGPPPVTMATADAIARGNANFIITKGTGYACYAGRFLFMPLEYKPFAIGPGLSLYWELHEKRESPVRSAYDRIRHPQQRMRGLKAHLPNWRWW